MTVHELVEGGESTGEVTILEDVDVFEGDVFPDSDIAFGDSTSAFLALCFTVFRVGDSKRIASWDVFLASLTVHGSASFVMMSCFG